MGGPCTTNCARQQVEKRVDNAVWMKHRKHPGYREQSSLSSAVAARIDNRRSLRLLALIVALATVAPLLFASPAAAHVGFDDSDPAEGTTVEGPVDQIQLVFTGPVEPVGEQFAALDPELGLRSPTSALSSDMLTWTLEFDPPLSAGEIAVRWTVQSEDAHVISGGLVFTAITPDPEPTEAEVAEVDVAEQSPAEETEAADVAAADAEPADGAAGLPEEATPGRSSGETSVEPADMPDAGEADESIDVGLTQAPEVTETSELASTSANDFVAQGRSQVATAAMVGAFGRAISYTAAMAAIGGFIFAQLILRSRRDLENAVIWLRRFGLLILVGAAFEAVAQVVVEVGEWSLPGLADLLASTAGLSFGLRFLGGLAWWGLPDPDLARNEVLVSAPTRQLSTAVRGPGSSSPDRPSRMDRGRDLAETFTEYRWQSGASSSLAVLGLALLTISHLFDGHTLSEGNRLVTSFATVAHVLGGAVWGGGVIMLALTLWARRHTRQPLHAMELGIRFSIVAAAALVVVGLAGVVLSLTILDSASGLWTTPWGQLLLIKIFVVLLAAAMGAYNHRILLPSAVESRSIIGISPVGARLRLAVGVEALVMITVLVVTAMLVGAAS